MAKGGKRKTAAGRRGVESPGVVPLQSARAVRVRDVLTGTEVKSLREGKAQLKDSYAAVRDGEVWLFGVYIPPYGPASRENHDPERPRKLLLHRTEIDRLIGSTREQGLTLVPTRIYFCDGRGPRSRSRWLEARTSTTSARRSASARCRATSSASCARRGGSPAAASRLVDTPRLRVDLRMTIGGSLALIAVGAIMNWAVTGTILARYSDGRHGAVRDRPGGAPRRRCLHSGGQRASARRRRDPCTHQAPGTGALGLTEGAVRSVACMPTTSRAIRLR